jgi:hypothetical protein
MATIVIGLISLNISLIATSPAFAVVADGVGVVQSGLIFSFDAANPNGGTGSTMTNLVTSNSGVSGTLQAGATRSSANGNTFSFDGGTSSFATVSIGSTDFSSGFSLSFYAKFTSATLGDRTFERIIDFASSAASGGDANNSMWVGRQADSNDLAVEVWNGFVRPNNCRAVNAIQPNVFTHYVVTVSGATCSFYVNKVLQTTTGSGGINPPVANRASAFIGKSNWTDDYFKGDIGEIAMYNTVLTQSDVNQNFNAQTDITAPTMISPASPYSITMAENTTSVALLNVPTAAFFSIVAGNDSSRFAMYGAVLSFVTGPNFEAPTDSAPFNSYIVTVRTMDANGNFSDWTITANITDVIENTQIILTSLSSTGVKGVPLTITVTPSGDGTSIPGRVTYLSTGKRIPGCIRKTYSGSGTSTCSWKPSIQGNRDVEVLFTPNNSNFLASSAKRSIFISKRNSNR